MKKVKYWKVVKSNLKLHDALNMLKAQAVEGHLCNYLAIRLGYKLILPDVKIDELLFSIKEMENENWEAIVPDDGKEELLYKIRELVKNENFLRASYEKIDNMNIADIWNAIDDIITISDDQVKYRLIKTVIENKLYKKA
jgi:hypothetical protein